MDADKMNDLGRDLVLKYRTGEKGDEEFDNVILPNVPGHRYTFGSMYPGVREGEEFHFCRYKGDLVNPTHFVITVDELVQYWIKNEIKNNDEKNTFVNSKGVTVTESRPLPLKSGDVISLGDKGTEWPKPEQPGQPVRPVYHVEERIIPNCGPAETEERNSINPYSGSKMVTRLSLRLQNSSKAGLEDDAESPLANSLILSEIMSYLSVPDLKNARLVSKKWAKEASRALEKKAQVSFDFGIGYINPKFSSRVARYLQEMKGLKIRNLRIILQPAMDYRRPYSLEQNPLRFSPGEPGHKMLDDFRKLLNCSHKFSTLSLKSYIRKESEFVIFRCIFQYLGRKLVELNLEGPLPFLPAVPPPFPIMPNLRKFTHKPLRGADALKQRWVSYIAPSFAQNVEHFTCNSDNNMTKAYLKQHFTCKSDNDMTKAYLQEFLKNEMPKLKGIAIEGPIGPRSLSLLLELENPLTSLKIEDFKLYSESTYVESWRDYSRMPLLERLLLKNSKSLKKLVLKVGLDSDSNPAKIKFPPFPNLIVLELRYALGTKVNWGRRPLNYKKHFPSLRKLKIDPEDWSRKKGEDDHVFNSFFPETTTMKGGMRVETVKDLWALALPDPRSCFLHARERRESFQPRMAEIREMFPNCVNMNFVR